MIRSGIYAIVNVRNGMRYIGSSNNLDYRMEQHFHALEDGRHHNYLLQRAFDASGDVWVWIVLEYCVVADLERNEQKWLHRGARFGRLYNINMRAERNIPSDAIPDKR
jgi:group I intron endonuclease